MCKCSNQNEEKPNDRVGPVVPKIYEKSVKPVRRPYLYVLLKFPHLLSIGQQTG